MKAREELEPLEGVTPWDLVARDPSGRLAAYKISRERAGVWDLQTKELVWDGEGAVAISWFPDGNEVAVLRNVYAENPERHGSEVEIVSPLMSDFEWFFDRRTWPECEVVATCPITNWMTDFETVTVSPTANLAVVSWGHQSEAGLILVSVAHGLATQVEGVSWVTDKTNWLSVPAWSLDGSNLVVFENPHGASNWWGGEDDDEPSPGGEFSVSTLVVLGPDLRELSRTPIRVEVPRGWLPATDDDRGISTSRFESDEVLTARVPTRGDQRISLADLH